MRKREWDIEKNKERRLRVGERVWEWEERDGLNFINVLHTAFTLIDPKSVKRYWQLDWVLTIWGATSVKAARKYVDEIYTWSVVKRIVHFISFCSISHFLWENQIKVFCNFQNLLFLVSIKFFASSFILYSNIFLLTSYIFSYTVKPVYNDHHRDPKFVAVVDRWLLFKS